ncbi:hypothetical protein NL676_027600 [Syzygium grande]|nr:hypothetical protein NL676_027600 [Syzygium grande]
MATPADVNTQYLPSIPSSWRNHAPRSYTCDTALMYTARRARRACQGGSVKVEQLVFVGKVLRALPRSHNNNSPIIVAWF